VWVISVNESRVIIIITGCPSLFVARIKKDSGTTLISVKPACLRSLSIFCCVIGLFGFAVPDGLEVVTAGEHSVLV
jgi:hypothetical protein